jgi:hypothetical protein
MRQHLTGLVLACAAVAAPAAAQDVWDDPGGIETSATYEVGAVLAPDADESALYVLRGGFEANFVLENGAELGVRTSAALGKDHPDRAGPSPHPVRPAPSAASRAARRAKTSARAAASKPDTSI